MNINPVLMCGQCRAFTLHIFVDRRPARHVPGEFLYNDLKFACDRCGEIRVYGNEEREETAYGRWLNKEAFAHAVDKHGMRRVRCPSCHGSGNDCLQCGGEGKSWAFSSREPCGPDCPIAGLGHPEDE
jgi:hypothetical protein